MQKKILLAAAIFVFLSFAIAITSFIVVTKNINNPVNSQDTRTIAFEVEQGQGVQTIVDGLEKLGLINGSDYFKLYLWRTDLGSKLKAGNYEFSPSMTIAQIVDILTGGESGIKSNETQVVIPEGTANDQILEKLKIAGAISGEKDFSQLQLDLSEYDFLSNKPEEADLQGFLFPDTYNFFKNASLEDVTTDMLDNFDRKLTTEMREEIKKHEKTIYETIILASIVEKEAGNKEEMPTIASVFYNRLGIGQPLQSDATVNYVTNAGRAMPTSEDLETDSPYNTYKYPGLPPTPICNPGIEAIKAAIYPAQTDYFYFLTTQDEEQNTYFSRTYEEHLQNKAMYLK
ncbi:MAG: endolytic transglycosylase MltG [Candidatus Pacebacteria bacterium]|nr:endolytic transglycosylase MltG [Candidatus Paceibacterota bacterium]